VGHVIAPCHSLSQLDIAAVRPLDPLRSDSLKALPSLLPSLTDTTLSYVGHALRRLARIPACAGMTGLARRTAWFEIMPRTIYALVSVTPAKAGVQVLRPPS
jgi:hypothetical protein